jgi:single stranded DNA-binding protein
LSDTRIMTITGRLGRDATVKYYDGDTKKLLELAIANEIGFGDKKDMMWISATSFRKNDISFAEGSGYKKGALVCVMGEYKIERYTGNDGTQKEKHTVKADYLQQLAFPVAGPAPQQQTLQPAPQQQGNWSQPQNAQTFQQQPPVQQQAQQPGWGNQGAPQSGPKLYQGAQPQQPQAGGWGGDDEIPF